MKLDKKLPYGHVFGDLNGAAFEQGGVMFDGAGNSIGVEIPPQAKRNVTKSAKKVISETDGDSATGQAEPSQVDSQLAAQAV